MEIDAYAPCPCGSGKKLKFCCASIVDEMGKVVRLRESDQLRPALAILEKLEKSHPDNAWVCSTQAEIHDQLDEAHAAKEIAKKVVETHPDYVPAYPILAAATMHDEGYEAARPAICRAFQKGIPKGNLGVGSLALQIAEVMERHGRILALRQHLALAVRFVGEEAREEVFSMLLRLDGSADIPYPLRSVHNLVPYGEGPHAAEAAKAAAVAGIACWSPAARAFARLIELEPERFALWHNLALCRAWDGDDQGASEAFHKAAAAAADYPTAVESETLAQILEAPPPDDILPFEDTEYTIHSPSRLLSRLEGHEQFLSAHLPEESGEHEPPLAGLFLMLDRPRLESERPNDPQFDDVTLDQVPVVVGSVVIYDALPERGIEAVARLSGAADDAFRAGVSLFEQAAREEIVGSPRTNQDGDISKSLLPFSRDIQVPERMPIKTRRKLARDYFARLIDGWLSTPQKAFDNKSPLEVRGDAKFRVRLAAACYRLEALNRGKGMAPDLTTLFERLQLEPLPPLTLRDDLPLSALSSMQMLRLPAKELSDAQLINAHRRAILIGHPRFATEILSEVVARPQVLSQVDADRVFQTLVTMARDEDRTGDALAWIAKAKEFVSGQRDSFMRVLAWIIAEFWIRAKDPEDPELRNLYNLLSDYYAPKVPYAAELVRVFREAYANRVSWLGQSVLVGSAAGMSENSGGIWTPSGAPSSAPQGAGKLWLPGQS